MTLRKIHTGNEIWQYKIYYTDVVIYNPRNNKKIIVTLWDIAGGYGIYKDIEKRRFHCTPQMIKDYIELHLV